MLLYQQTQYAFKLSLGYSQTTLHSQNSWNNWLYTPNRTQEGSIACCCLLSRTHCLSCLSWCRSLSQKLELVFIMLRVKSQWQCYWDILVIRQMLPVIKHANFLATVYRCMAHTKHLSCCGAQLNLIFSMLWPKQHGAELSWVRL